MKWQNLKINKCPQCGRLLGFNSEQAYCSCGFRIRLLKMEAIVMDQASKGLEAWDDLADYNEP